MHTLRDGLIIGCCLVWSFMGGIFLSIGNSILKELGRINQTKKEE
jgi:hypothetical protein